MSLKKDTGDKKDLAWYIVNTVIGKEGFVKRNIMHKVDSMGAGDVIVDIVIPSVKKIKVRGTKKIESDEKVYPGYIFVKMAPVDDALFIIRSVPGVIGFAGVGGVPTAVSDEEMADILNSIEVNKNIKHEVKIEVGDLVKIIEGPFAGSQGKVEAIDRVKGRAVVMVPMFGRDVPLELMFEHIEKI